MVAKPQESKRQSISSFFDIMCSLKKPTRLHQSSSSSGSKFSLPSWTLCPPDPSVAHSTIPALLPTQVFPTKKNTTHFKQPPFQTRMCPASSKDWEHHRNLLYFTKPNPGLLYNTQFQALHLIYILLGATVQLP
jgi:hypothetical protein